MCEFWEFRETAHARHANRCCSIERLSVHHLSYPRVLGTESVDTLKVLCKAHHEMADATRAWWRPKGRRA